MSADTASVVGRPKLRLPDSEKACPDNFRNFRIVIQSASQTAAEPRRSFFEAFYVDLSMKVGQEKRPESLEQMAGHPVLSQSPQRSEMGFVPGILSVHHPLQHPIPFRRLGHLSMLRSSPSPFTVVSSKKASESPTIESSGKLS
ncbi:hypothetical protein KC323_g94 [Hortaea werneckii]|nr:hypothetical protein KC323_g94 [Hortaea werneckii]